MKKSKKNKGEIIELNLTKNELDKLSEYLDSDNFRNYGFGHIEFENGDMLLISCKELIENRESYEEYLIEIGLKPEEIVEQLNSIDKKHKK